VLIPDLEDILDLSTISVTTPRTFAGSKLRELLSEQQRLPDLEKLKQLASVRKQEVNGLLPETAQCIERILQSAAKGSVKDCVKILFEVSKVVKRHESLRPAVESSPCKELVVSMLQAASENERVYHNSFTMSQICVAQYTLQISCEQLWQKVPENCIEKLNDRAACSVVYAYGKLLDGGAVPPATDGFKVLQYKVVARHATHLGAQGVANTAWSLSKQGLLVADAAVHLQEAAARTSAAMDAQNVANTVWTFGNMELQLGEAKTPIMRAVLRVSDSMNAQNVANTFWGCAKMRQDLGEAQEPMICAVLRVVDSMNAQNVANTLWAFVSMDLNLGEAEQPMMRAILRVSDRMKPMMRAILRVSESMNAQNVANTLWAFVSMDLNLGEAEQPMMRAILRVSDRMNAQDVANTLWALSHFDLKPGTAHACLLKRVPIVASSFNDIGLRQVKYGLNRLQEEGYSGECMEAALRSVGV
jgi:hypothetical protein